LGRTNLNEKLGVICSKSYDDSNGAKRWGVKIIDEQLGTINDTKFALKEKNLVVWIDFKDGIRIIKKCADILFRSNGQGPPRTPADYERLKNVLRLFTEYQQRGYSTHLVMAYYALVESDTYNTFLGRYKQLMSGGSLGLVIPTDIMNEPQMAALHRIMRVYRKYACRSTLKRIWYGLACLKIDPRQNLEAQPSRNAPNPLAETKLSKEILSLGKNIPGSLRVLGNLVKRGNKHLLSVLRSHNITGTKIWVLYKSKGGNEVNFDAHLQELWIKGPPKRDLVYLLEVRVMNFLLNKYEAYKARQKYKPCGIGAVTASVEFSEKLKDTENTFERRYAVAFVQATLFEAGIRVIRESPPRCLLSGTATSTGTMAGRGAGMRR